MRLVNADELIEHAWRDKLDSRELIVEMIERAPTVKRIPTQIPIEVYERLLEQEPKTGHWMNLEDTYGDIVESVCSNCDHNGNYKWDYCPNCGAKMKREVSK